MKTIYILTFVIVTCLPGIFAVNNEQSGYIYGTGQHDQEETVVVHHEPADQHSGQEEIKSIEVVQHDDSHFNGGHVHAHNGHQVVKPIKVKDAAHGNYHGCHSHGHAHHEEVKTIKIINQNNGHSHTNPAAVNHNEKIIKLFHQHNAQPHRDAAHGHSHGGQQEIKIIKIIHQKGDHSSHNGYSNGDGNFHGGHQEIKTIKIIHQKDQNVHSLHGTGNDNFHGGHQNFKIIKIIHQNFNHGPTPNVHPHIDGRNDVKTFKIIQQAGKLAPNSYSHNQGDHYKTNTFKIIHQNNEHSLGNYAGGHNNYHTQHHEHKYHPNHKEHHIQQEHHDHQQHQGHLNGDHQKINTVKIIEENEGLSKGYLQHIPVPSEWN